MTRHCAVLACNDVECAGGVACRVNYADTAFVLNWPHVIIQEWTEHVHLVAHLSKFSGRLVEVCSEYWGKFILLLPAVSHLCMCQDSRLDVTQGELETSRKLSNKDSSRVERGSVSTV